MSYREPGDRAELRIEKLESDVSDIKERFKSFDIKASVMKYMEVKKAIIIPLGSIAVMFLLTYTMMFWLFSIRFIWLKLESKMEEPCMDKRLYQNGCDHRAHITKIGDEYMCVCKTNP